MSEDEGYRRYQRIESEEEDTGHHRLDDRARLALSQSFYSEGGSDGEGLQRRLKVPNNSPRVRVTQLQNRLLVCDRL